MKIFGIGLPKTGTRSLAETLKILGYKIGREKRKTQKTFKKELAIWEHLEEIIISNDSIILNNFCRYYNIFDKLYPNSKFILTVRDKNAWIESYTNWFVNTNHIDYEKESNRSILLKFLHDLKFATFKPNKKQLSILYDIHMEEVQWYFKKRKNLLIYNICASEGWEPLCNFLGKDIPEIEFPHKKVREDK